MSEKMYPIPFKSLMNWVITEYAGCGDVFGVHKQYHATGKSLPIFGERIETPFGPAAGPNSQLAQNIIAAYAAGARFFEVKTVQKMDGADLAACVPRPCILANDEGYNQEWSTELTVPQAMDEYIKAWCALKVLSKVYGFGDPDGFVFNMSVGYDLEGIKGEKVNTYIDNMMDASGTAQFQECLAVLTELFPQEKDFIASISPRVSRSVTVSTLHITVEGALQDKDGHAQFYQWNLENKSWTPGKLIKDGEISIESTTLASSDLMYLMDATADSWAMHKINTATGEDLGSANGAGVPLWDMAYSSLFSTEEQDQIVGVYYYYLFSPKDPMNLDAYGFKLQSFLQQVGASYFTAITSAGETTVKLKSGETVPAEMFLALDNKGNMWVLNLYYTEADGYGLSGGCYETTLPELAFGGHEDSMYCSLVMADEGTTDGLTLFLSYFTGDTNELYMLNLMQSSDGLYFDATDVGNVGDSVWPATVNRVYGNASIKGIQTAEAAAEKNDIELTAQTVSAEKIERSTQEASGSLNTVSNAAAPAAQRVAAVKGGSMTANGDVDLTLTADETTTNGLLEITWDPSLMDYVSGVSTAQLSSFQPAEGKLLFGYAAEKEIASDAVLANLKFRPKDDVHCDLEVQVKTLQRNVESGLDLSETIVVKNENVEHNWGEWIVTKQPTCFAPGEETRVCADCGAEQTREIPASTENCPSKAFSDLDNTQWYHEGVDYVLNNELMLGVGGSLFEPDGTVTRAQLAMVLYRVAGKPDVKNTANPFKDVTEGVWYADAVKWAAEAGVVKGISADEFAPEVPVTRQEIATMLYRFAKAEAVAEDKLAAFPDAASVADWAKDAMNWAVATGLINGVKAADGTVTLDAQSGATRAQIATLLMRFLKG